LVLEKVFRGETKTAVLLAGWRGCSQESRAGALEA
jgi:hypothetical protein